MFCRWCEKEIDDGREICPYCHVKQIETEPEIITIDTVLVESLPDTKLRPFYKRKSFIYSVGAIFMICYLLTAIFLDDLQYYHTRYIKFTPEQWAERTVNNYLDNRGRVLRNETEDSDVLHVLANSHSYTSDRKELIYKYAQERAEVNRRYRLDNIYQEPYYSILGTKKNGDKMICKLAKVLEVYDVKAVDGRKRAFLNKVLRADMEINLAFEESQVTPGRKYWLIENISYGPYIQIERNHFKGPVGFQL